MRVTDICTLLLFAGVSASGQTASPTPTDAARLGSTHVPGRPDSAFRRFLSFAKGRGVLFIAVDSIHLRLEARARGTDEHVLFAFDASGDSTTVSAQGAKGGMPAMLFGFGEVNDWVLTLHPGPPKRRGAVTATDIRAIVLAIQDEIYADGYAPSYEWLDNGFDAGRPDRIPLYIDPTWGHDGMTWVIYRLLPLGEVRRAVWPVGDGTLMKVSSDPKAGFDPAWYSAAAPTAYLDEDDVLQMKKKWRRLSFAIESRPDSDRVTDATRRQAARAKY